MSATLKMLLGCSDILEKIKVKERPAKHLAHVPAKHLGHLSVDIRGAAFRIQQPDALLGRLHDAPVALLAALHGLLVLDPLGHVPVDRDAADNFSLGIAQRGNRSLHGQNLAKFMILSDIAICPRKQAQREPPPDSDRQTPFREDHPPCAPWSLPGSIRRCASRPRSRR